MLGEHATVLVVDDDQSLSRLVAHWVRREQLQVEVATTVADALSSLTRMLPDVVLLDLELPDAHGLSVLDHVKQHHPRLPVVIMTGNDDLDMVVRSVQAGAYDYLAKPLRPQKLLTTLRNAIDKGRSDLKIAQLEREVRGGRHAGMLGDSPPMRELYRQLDRVAPSDITVLVQGESGTGKELVARALHAASGRHGAPFVALNCAAIPETLQESELFGHDKGSFTGADRARPGRFEQADGGTLFLDEVAELSPALQAKLLRALQERCFYRVGGTHEVEVDVRIVAATHRDLRRMVREGGFREDLYYRLNVFELALPPLRERGADLMSLAAAFLTQFGRGQQLELSRDAQAAMLQYPWPGNVRELRNAMERASVLARDGRIELADLPSQFQPGGREVLALRGGRDPSGDASEPSVRSSRLADLEKQAIVDALEQCGGNVSDVVRTLGIPRTTLYRRLKAYGLR